MSLGEVVRGGQVRNSSWPVGNQQTIGEPSARGIDEQLIRDVGQSSGASRWLVITTPETEQG